MKNTMSFRATARNLQFLLAITCASPLAAQTPASTRERAREVVMRHMDAIGGLQAYSAVKSMHAVMLLRIPAYDVDIGTEMWISKPNLAYMVSRSQFGWSEAGSDGKRYWTMDSEEGPRILTRPPDVLNAHVFDPYAALTMYDVTYVGVRDRGGKKHDALQLTAGDGLLYTQYYDRETGLLSRVEVGNPSAPASSMRFDRYRKFGGILYATQVITRVGDMELAARIKSVDHKPVDAKRYEAPRAIRDLAAKTP